MPGPSIAIVGAGPAGLTLARLLLALPAAASPPLPASAAPVVTVFERDAGPASRGPSAAGTLDLHTETGLLALRKAGLWDEFNAVARYEGEEMIFGDRRGLKLIHIKSAGDFKTGQARPEIDRV